jgi:hypothetical protein
MPPWVLPLLAFLVALFHALQVMIQTMMGG